MNIDASKVTNFRWYAVATASRDYPMKVISGTFYFKSENSGIGIPSGGTIHTGWGKSASVYVGGDKIPPLPDRVKVEFYSYAENQFYKAEFALPYDLILAKFQQQLKDHPDEDLILVKWVETQNLATGKVKILNLWEYQHHL